LEDYWIVFVRDGASGGLQPEFNLSDVSDPAVARGNLGLAIGTDVQEYNARLFAGIPYGTAKTADHTVTIDDVNKIIPHSGADNNPRTFTIAAQASVAYPSGAFLGFHKGANVLTIAPASEVTLIFLGSGAKGARQLAANGLAIAIRASADTWLIIGVGLS